jgi:hypothetical protein
MPTEQTVSATASAYKATAQSTFKALSDGGYSPSEIKTVIDEMRHLLREEVEVQVQIETERYEKNVSKLNAFIATI